MSALLPEQVGSVQSLIQERARQALRMSVDLPSPCISICQLDKASGLCIGCFRSMEEICAWSAMDDRRKHDVWRLIDKRSAT